MSKLYGKQVNDIAWAQFVSFMNYKAIKEGKFVIKIDRYYSSTQLCSSCGYQNKELTLEDREWICPKCGTFHDRDINAAINILVEGKRILFGENENTVGTTGIHACGDKTSG